MIMQRKRPMGPPPGRAPAGADRLRKIDAYWRAANYLGAAQLYLRDNVLLGEGLRPDHIKARPAGCWGTQPGLNLIYAHLNRLIQDSDAHVMLVVGPGHGAAAILANLYLEESLHEVDAGLSLDEAGATRLARQFGSPDGVDVLLAPSVPGMIQDGGEPGHSLARAFGAAMDNPDLLVACVIGDGEAETGSLASAWHSTKLFDPATNGAVLPILHLNGWGQSGPAILGRMDNDELESLFAGYGYDIGIVSGDDPLQVHEAMWQAMDWAHQEIRDLQEAARAGEMPDQPTWPLLVIRTAKGWTGPREVDGLQVEGTFRSHGLPVTNPAGNEEHLAILEQWLRSYGPQELFDEMGGPSPDVRSLCPTGDRRIGRNEHAAGGPLETFLKMPEAATSAVAGPGRGKANPVAVAAEFIRDVFATNQEDRHFRLFSADEIPGNGMEAVLEAADRAWVWPIDPTDSSLAWDGRVMEMANPQVCQGWLEGYVLTGRHGLFAGHEKTLAQLGRMIERHTRWTRKASQTAWRRPAGTMNYLATRCVWSEDASAATGEAEGLADRLLRTGAGRVYLPPDANCVLAVMDRCLRERDRVNLIVAGDETGPVWLDLTGAIAHCRRGVSVWRWAGYGDEEPDIVLACAGAVPTLETLEAAYLLHRELPDLRFRVVNVVDPLLLDPATEDGLDEEAFCGLFGVDCPVVFAFHGNPRVVHDLLSCRPEQERFCVHGYLGQGGPTTPLGLRIANRMSRYDLATAGARQARRRAGDADAAMVRFEEERTRHEQYIREHGQDMPEVDR